MACGARLGPEQPANRSAATPLPGAFDSSSATLDHLHKFVPREYMEHLRDADGQATSDRRVVTILFCDVTDSTAMSEKLDPEDTMAIMNSAFEVLVEPIIRYGGTLARLTGDGVLAFFGAPVANEDDALRACHAAIDMIGNARRYGETLRVRRGIDGFDVRIGIHTGLVVVGEVGSDLRAEYTAMGDAINLAARMQSAAVPGTILLTRHTRELVGDSLVFEDMGTMQLKGKTEPIHAYRLTGTSPGPREHAAASTLFGRESELHLICESVGAVAAGHGGLLTVTGEPGVGKTRLIAEARSVSRGVHWVTTHCASYAQATGYHLARDLLFNLVTADSQLPTASAHPLDVSPDCGAETTTSAMTPSRMRAQIVETLRETLVASANKGPLVVLLDDLQWADPSSLEVLAEIFPIVDSEPVLFLLCNRPGAESLKSFSHAVSARGARSLRVGSLGENDARALLDALLAGRDVPDLGRRLILSAAEGNAFFIHEVARAWIELGLAEGAWSADLMHLSNVVVPITVRGAITARLDRLQARDRQMLQTAAVIGRAFDSDLLADLLASTMDLDELHRRLDAMAATGLIHGAAGVTLEPCTSEFGHNSAPHSRHFIDRAGTSKSVFMFRDPMITEVCYKSLLKSERHALHRRVAEAIERRCTSRGAAPPASVLAYHFDKAGDRNRAIVYLKAAAEHAARVGAACEAEAFERRACELLSHPEDQTKRESSGGGTSARGGLDCSP